MKKIFILAIAAWCINGFVFAQALTDSLVNKSPLADTANLAIPAAADTTYSFFYQQFSQSGLATDAPIIYQIAQTFTPPSADTIFFVLLGLLLLLGIIRIGFSKYYVDMLRIFSQSTFRQKGIRDQLLQNRLASMMMNFFFCLSAGVFLYQVALYYHWNLSAAWWQQLLFCTAFVAVVYFAKYVGLQMSGWLFGMPELVDTYTFMVFLINKVVGVLLLPASVVLALGALFLKPVIMVTALTVLMSLFLYRYIIALPLLRQYVKVIPIHFFLYFCAFEIIPVLLVYKWTVGLLKG